MADYKTAAVPLSHVASILEPSPGIEPESIAYQAIILPTELQRLWSRRGASNSDLGVTNPALFPLSYIDSGGARENRTPGR